MNLKIAVGAVGLVALLVGLVVLPLSLGETGDDRFSAYADADDWEGASKARGVLETAGYDVANVGSSTMILQDVDPTSTLLFIVGLERPYASFEMDALDDFLGRGGSVVVLDDRGFGGDYTQRHGIDFLRANVLDEFSRNKSFVWAKADLAGQQHDVLLDGPVALEDVDANDTRLVPFIVNTGFLDLNRDGKIDAVDKGGVESGRVQTINIGIRKSFPSGGDLVVISDSGWIIDDVLDRQPADARGRDTNVEFLKALVSDTIGAEGLILFDESRRGTVGLESGFYTAEKGLLGLFRSIPLIGVFFTLAFLGLLIALLLEIPGREDWRHRFRPGQRVPGPEEGKRQMLRDILHAQVEIAGTIEKIKDAVVRQAAADPDSVRDEDLDLVLDRVVTGLSLDVKSQEQNPT